MQIHDPRGTGTPPPPSPQRGGHRPQGQRPPHPSPDGGHSACPGPAPTRTCTLAHTHADTQASMRAGRHSRRQTKAQGPEMHPDVCSDPARQTRDRDVGPPTGLLPPGAWPAPSQQVGRFLPGPGSAPCAHTEPAPLTAPQDTSQGLRSEGSSNHASGLGPPFPLRTPSLPHVLATPSPTPGLRCRSRVQFGHDHWTLTQLPRCRSPSSMAKENTKNQAQPQHPGGWARPRPYLSTLISSLGRWEGQAGGLPDLKWQVRAGGEVGGGGWATPLCARLTAPRTAPGGTLPGSGL